MKKLVILAVFAAALAGCTDAERASLSALGEAGHVKVFSGGRLIYEGDSTGKISTTKNSDGWEFKDAATGKFVRVSGDVLISN